MEYDLYVWEAPRDLDAAGAAGLVQGWEAEGGDPAASPFEPSSNTGWFAREMARDAPSVELLTDSPAWTARGPIWVQTEPAPPARVVAMRLGPASSRADLEEILGLATKYDLVLYDARHGRVTQPLEAMSEYASATFWPGGAIRSIVIGLVALVVTVVAWIAGIPILSGLIAAVGGFMVVLIVVTLVAEARGAMARRGRKAA